MGGNLFSCHAAGGRRPRSMRKLHKYNGNRLSREDLNFIYQYSGTTPLAPLPTNGHAQRIPIPVLTSTPAPVNGSAVRLLPSLTPPPPSSNRTSTVTMSKASSRDLSEKVQPSSAPSSPTIRRNAPPKPPRMRSVIQVDNHDHIGTILKMGDHTYMNMMDLSPAVSVRSTQPPATPRTLRTSLEDITSALSDDSSSIYSDGRRTISRSHMTHNSSKIMMKGKVYDVILKTRGYLLQEIDPEDILEHLCKNGVISERTEVEIRKCCSKDAMCEILLDVVMSKGHKEFSIFCDCLRKIGGLNHLADLLEVLDTLIEIVTESNTKCRSRDSSRSRAGSQTNMASRGASPCHMCVKEASEEDAGQNAPNFDIDVSYYDSEVGSMRTIQEIAGIKADEGYKLASTVKSLSKEQLNRFVPVMSVSFYNQCLGRQGIKTLCKLLSDYRSVRELNLAKNHIDESGMNQLGKALENNRGLSKLDIRLNTIGDLGASALQKGLASNQTLKVLNVTSTGLTGQDCNLLVQGLTNTTSLVELDVGFNDLQNEGCETIALVLSHNCSLKKLRMRDNSICAKGGEMIFKALRKNSRLTTLDLSSNKLGDECMQCLSEMLLLNRSLKELNLENTHLSSGACPALARALKTNTVLKLLDISMNTIGNSGATALSEGLRYNRTATTLCMNMCGIGNFGFIPLLDSLMFNTTLTALKLCYNHIGEIPLQPPPGGKHKHKIRHVPVMGVTGVQINNELRPPAERQDNPLSLLQEKYMELINNNPDLKILLWGNKLEESWHGGIPETPTSIISCNF